MKVPLIIGVPINEICKIFNITKKTTRSVTIMGLYRKKNYRRKTKLTFQIKRKLEKDFKRKQGIGTKKVQRKYNISSRTIRRWLKT